jgi:hypothetical protein
MAEEYASQSKSLLSEVKEVLTESDKFQSGNERGRGSFVVSSSQADAE